MTREQLLRVSDGFFEGGAEPDEEYQAWVEQYRALTAQEYAELKELIWGRASRGGGFLTLYIFLVVSGPAALCALAGCAGGLAYLAWLFRDVDAVTVETRSHVFEADEIDNAWLRRGAKLVAAYRHGVNARLVVPVALAAGIWAWNHAAPAPLTNAEEGCVLLGFLSHKAGTVSLLWDEYKPKTLSRDELRRQETGGRPSLPTLPDDPEVEFKDDRVNRLRY